MSAAPLDVRAYRVAEKARALAELTRQRAKHDLGGRISDRDLELLEVVEQLADVVEDLAARSLPR